MLKPKKHTEVFYMQIGRTVKKLAAISTGALMLGATLTGALAASYKLADYPAPFLKNGMLDNTVIVVGKNAATADVVGAIDLAAALQAEAVSKVSVEGTSTAPTINDGVKIERSGVHYIFGRDIYDVKTSLDQNDLPEMLKEETFKDTKGDNKGSTDYKQTISFSNGVGELVLSQPEDMKGGVYVKLPKNSQFYTYTLDFNTPITYSTASTDLEGTSLKIQGNTYTITEVTEESDLITKMKLVAGESTVWLLQDQPYTVGDHTVTVVNVDENGDSCGVNVDGTTVWIDSGSTEEVNGLSVGVLDVKVVHSKDYDQDTCELTLGSSEIVLEEGEPVKVNNEELEGTSVDISTTTNRWDGFSITFTTGKMENPPNDGDIHLMPGADGQPAAWTDPVFGNWKLTYAGTTADTETLKFKSTGDDATFTFTNNDGKEVQVPFHYTGSAIILGTDDDEHLLMPGDTTGTLSDVEGTMFFYTTANGEVHILEMTSLSCGGSTNKTTIKDLTYDTYVAKDLELTADCQDSSIETLDLGSLGEMKLNLTNTKITYVKQSGYGYDDTNYTKYEGNLGFSDTEVTFTEKDGDETSQTPFTFNLTYDSADDDTIEMNWETTFTWVNNDENDDDIKWAKTAKGTLLKYDNKDQLWVEIYHPEEDLYANVFISPVKAEVVGGTAGGSTADKVNPFSVGLAVLDEEAEKLTKNMIVVGGPCANTIASELMGNPTQCAEGFEAGKAMLKFFERNGKAALLVAGYDAEDTVNAAYVLAQHNKKYAEDFKKLTGDEVVLSVADMSKVVFSTA